MSEQDYVNSRHCSQCHALMKTHRHGVLICDDCLAKMGIEMRRHTPPRDFPADWTMDDKNAKARELGLSYGKFVALVHDGVINIKELTKPIDITAGRRRVVRHRAKRN